MPTRTRNKNSFDTDIYLKILNTDGDFVSITLEHILKGVVEEVRCVLNNRDVE